MVMVEPYHMVVSSIRTPGMVRFWRLGKFFYLNLPQSRQLQITANTVGKLPAMD